MDPHPHVEYGSFQVYTSPNTAVSTSFHEIPSNMSSRNRSTRYSNPSRDEIGHVRSDNNTHWPLLLGLTSSPLGRAAPLEHSSNQFTMEHYRTVQTSASLPFKYEVHPVALPTPIWRQKWEIQLAERELFDPTFSLQNPEPYTHVGDPPLTKVPCQIAPSDKRLAGVVEPSPHFSPSIDYVGPIYCISLLFTSRSLHNSSPRVAKLTIFHRR